MYVLQNNLMLRLPNYIDRNFIVLLVNLRGRINKRQIMKKKIFLSQISVLFNSKGRRNANILGRKHNSALIAQL